MCAQGSSAAVPASVAVPRPRRRNVRRRVAPAAVYPAFMAVSSCKAQKDINGGVPDAPGLWGVAPARYSSA